MKFLVTDNGLYTCQAEALSDNGKNEVRFCTPWSKPFPTYADYAIGKNYGNLKKELYFFDHIQSADCIVNFDVPQNDLMNYLKKVHPDKSIFGAGLGERLENDRVMFKQWLEKLGLAVNKYEVIVGLTNLKNYLKNNPKKFVKTNIFRNDMESFYFSNWKDDRYLLDEKLVVLGMHAEEYTFIVEEPIETECEIGYDGFFSNGKYIPFSYGYEICKNLYIGKVVEDMEELPEPLYETLDAFQGLLNRMDYRGSLSTEERIVSPSEHYFMDFCARIPAPLGQIYPIAIKNWPELVYKIGKKEDVKVECDSQYVGAFALSSEHAADHYVKIMVEDKHLKDVRFQMVSQNEDGYFAVKGNTAIVVLVAQGESSDEVLNKLLEAKDYVEAYGLEKDDIDGIQKQAQEAIKGGQKVGIKF